MFDINEEMTYLVYVTKKNASTDVAALDRDDITWNSMWYFTI